MMLLRVERPKSVTKPIRDPTESSPPPAKTASAPPTSAKGIVNAVAIEHLSDLQALEGRFGGLEHRGGREAKGGDAVMSQPDDEFGRAGLGLDRHVRGATHPGHHLANALGGTVERIEVVATQRDHDFGGRAGERLLHPLHEKGHDLEGEARELEQRPADFGHEPVGFLAAHLGQLDMQFAVVRAERILAQLGAAGLLGNGDDALVLEQFGGHPFAHLERMPE